MADVAFSICVYLGSRPGNNPLFTEAAVAVGRWIGQRGGQLVYGGGLSGLMGTVAEATRQAGGRVVGVIPEALVDKELANHLCDKLHIVNTMHERKAMMAERCDAFIALPGGIGTLEELFEVWTWRQLGYHDKPIGLLDIDGYYSSMLGFLQHAVHNGLMSDWQMDLIRTGAEPHALLASLVQDAGVNAETITLRSVI
ncbi:TIGR00730 family Rossman fold protein [Diaphorobacter sp.]|uniref:LOG family protein n=1 Tax=Diaphorobacter sp. TaxID=1934310 RepID=UPI003D0AED68